MRIIGLTGGIATGKSTVSAILRELGAEVIDADALAHAVTAPGSPTVSTIGRELGSEFLRPDGTLDRPLLARRVFQDEDLRLRLNAIVHPEVRRRMATAVAALRAKGAPLAVLDVPLLLESRAQYEVDAVWLVYAPQAVQIRRLMARNSLSYEEALARIRSQMPIEEKRRLADVVIENTGDLESLREQVVVLFRRLVTP